MIKFENTEVMGWESAIRGMRNPMNSWEKSDSKVITQTLKNEELVPGVAATVYVPCVPYTKIGPNDLKLMRALRNAGTDHRKFMRMITVYVDITAPLYWWKEFDTYKVGTVANSCSTMHKIADKEFELSDFSCEHLFSDEDCLPWDQREIDRMINDDALFVYSTGGGTQNWATPEFALTFTIACLNRYRLKYLEIGEEIKNTVSGTQKLRLMNTQKKYWWQMIQLLPSSYNQKRTVQLNYEVLANIYKSRKNHKLDEWSKHEINKGVESIGHPEQYFVGFCDWIHTLPYSELIRGDWEDKDG